jgi:hypothetical protein
VVFGIDTCFVICKFLTLFVSEKTASSEYVFEMFLGQIVKLGKDNSHVVVLSSNRKCIFRNAIGLPSLHGDLAQLQP